MPTTREQGCTVRAAYQKRYDHDRRAKLYQVCPVCGCFLRHVHRHRKRIVSLLRDVDSCGALVLIDNGNSFDVDHKRSKFGLTEAQARAVLEAVK